MPSIRMRNGKFQARVMLDGKAQVRTFDTLREAQKWAAQVERGMVVHPPTSHKSEKRSTSPKERLVTLADALERYERDVLPTKRGKAAERYIIARWQKHKLANEPLANITTKDLAAARDEQLKVLAAPSVRRHLDTLSGVLTVAWKDWHLIECNPMRNLRKPPQGRPRDRRVTPDELAYILQEARQFREMETFIVLAAESGMRRSEILSLRWENVNLEHRTAFLPTTKNGDSRMVPLTRKAADTLKAAGPATGRVFARVNASAVSTAFKRAVDSARARYLAEGGRDPRFLLNVRLHDLRHERISTLAEAGFSILELSAISGHKTLSMLKRYTHLSTDHLINRLDAVSG